MRSSCSPVPAASHRYSRGGHSRSHEGALLENSRQTGMPSRRAPLLVLLQLGVVAATGLTRRSSLAAVTAAAVMPRSAAASPSRSEGKTFQSDDGAFTFMLPANWNIVSACASSRRKCTLPGRRESVVACRAAGESILEATVDLGAFGNRLTEFATLDEAVSQLQALLPSTARLVSAQMETSGRGSQARYYTARFAGASGSERLIKLGVQQSRLYTLHLQTDLAPSAAMRAELEGIAETYQVFPVSSLRGGLLSSTAPAIVRPPSLKVLQ